MAAYYSYNRKKAHPKVNRREIAQQARNYWQMVKYLH